MAVLMNAGKVQMSASGKVRTGEEGDSCCCVEYKQARICCIPFPAGTIANSLMPVSPIGPLVDIWMTVPDVASLGSHSFHIEDDPTCYFFDVDPAQPIPGGTLYTLSDITDVGSCTVCGCECDNFNVSPTSVSVSINADFSICLECVDGCVGTPPCYIPYNYHLTSFPMSVLVDCTFATSPRPLFDLDIPFPCGNENTGKKIYVSVSLFWQATGGGCSQWILIVFFCQTNLGCTDEDVDSNNCSFIYSKPCTDGVCTDATGSYVRTSYNTGCDSCFDSDDTQAGWFGPPIIEVS